MSLFIVIVLTAYEHDLLCFIQYKHFDENMIMFIRQVFNNKIIKRLYNNVHTFYTFTIIVMI